jgi:uncharacterized protein DUF4412
MRKLQASLVFAAALGVVAAPGFAGVHYRSTTHTESDRGASSDVQVEGWVSGDKAKVAFMESHAASARGEAAPGAPGALKKGTYLLTRDGGRTIYLVDPDSKTYGEFSLDALMGLVGGIMNGMGPLLKVEFSDPKVEKVADENGGTVAGLPTRHLRYRTTYTLKMRVLGMGNTADVENDQDLWVTDRLQDVALGVWLRSDPPKTGNTQFDKLVAASRDKLPGFPLKMVTVSTNKQQRGGKTTVTRSSMEVTQLQTTAVPDATFAIPADYKETQMIPAAQAGEQGKDEEEQGGLRGLLRRKKTGGGGR